MPRSFGPITLDPGARILAFTDGAFPVDHHERLVARAATTDIGDVIDELAMRALGAGEASDDCSAFLIDCDRLPRWRLRHRRG